MRTRTAGGRHTGAHREGEIGQTLIEYVLILVLIALVVVLVLRGF